MDLRPFPFTLRLVTLIANLLTKLVSCSNQIHTEVPSYKPAVSTATKRISLSQYKQGLIYSKRELISRIVRGVVRASLSHSARVHVALFQPKFS